MSANGMDSSTQVDGEALDGTLNSSFIANGKRAEYRYRYRIVGGGEVLMVDYVI